jgi:cytochrome c-type biogenesis protein CcmE
VSDHATPRRHVRLAFALVVASLLGTFAVYTALIGDTTPLLGVAQAAAGEHAGQNVKLTGTVVSHTGDPSSNTGMRIMLADNANGKTMPVLYHGSVPDAFRDGRHIVVDGSLAHGTFHATTDSLVTKCPSKYAPPPPGSTVPASMGG